MVETESGLLVFCSISFIILLNIGVQAKIAIIRKNMLLANVIFTAELPAGFPINPNKPARANPSDLKFSNLKIIQLIKIINRVIACIAGFGSFIFSVTIYLFSR